VQRGQLHSGLYPADSINTNQDEILLVVRATATFLSKALDKLLFCFFFFDFIL